MLDVAVTGAASKILRKRLKKRMAIITMPKNIGRKSEKLKISFLANDIIGV